MKILMVEDDFLSRKLLKNILSKYGEVDMGADGYEAVEAFNYSIKKDDKYDIIFLDIMMPGMSGQEALKKIREKELELGVWGVDQVKIVMTTALDDVTNVKTAFKEQVDSYLVKPITREKIEKELDKLGLSE